MKDDWKIKDFTEWNVEERFSFEEAAYLCHEANPALDYSDYMKMEPRPVGYPGILSALVNNEEASRFYDNTEHMTYEYNGTIPREVWDKIIEMYKTLLKAAKTGALYRPTNDNSSLRGSYGDPAAYKVSRDDLRYFFAERLGQQPKFLFLGGGEEKSSEITDEEDFNLKEEDYKIWDLRTEVTYNEASCLLLNLNPNRCFAYSMTLGSTETSVIHKNLPPGTQAEIFALRDLLEEARRRGEFKETTPTGSYAFMSWPFTPKISIASLKAWAEKNNIRPQSLFTEQRGERKGQREKSLLPCKPGTKWADVTITLIADDTIKIKTSQGEGKFSYHQLGLSDKRIGDKPKVLWPLLKFFIKEHGFITSQNPHYDPKLPDTAKRLNRHLKKLFGIEDSIYTGHYKKERGYRVRFIVSDQTFNNDCTEISD